MLMVKWVCQDRFPGQETLPSISIEQFEELRWKLWKLPELLDNSDSTLRLHLSQLLRPQLGFQRDLSKGFVREAALLGEQHVEYPLRRLFREKTGFDVLEFIDLSLAIYSMIVKNQCQFSDIFLTSLHSRYAPEVVKSFLSSITRTYPELVTFFLSLPDANKKTTSEYYEFPCLVRYPFFRKSNIIICWHKRIFFRCLERYVHFILSEAGCEYMEKFSRIFEQHIITEAKKVPTRFIEEHELRKFIPSDAKVPDGLLSFPECNVFIESKARLHHESIMTTGNVDFFTDRTQAVRKAMNQASEASASLRNNPQVPSEVRNANTDYLLIVMNTEPRVSSGTSLEEMYRDGTLNYLNGAKFLPRKHIYVLDIEDFERLTSAVARREINLPTFLASCVHDDENPHARSLLFEQHLDKQQIPMQFSNLVEKAVAASYRRLEDSLCQNS